MLKKRRIFFLVICFAALCLSTAPASANLFDFSFSTLTSSYDGAGLFSASADKSFPTPGSPSTSGTVTSYENPTGVAEFLSYSWVLGGDFSLSMSISSISATSAYGAGSFVITDIDGDTITGDIAGTWFPLGGDNMFGGTMSNVEFIGTDGSFDGHMGSVQMDFISDPPWNGSLIELSSGGTWFSPIGYNAAAGGVIASVTGPVSTPVPAAVLLGIIGLGVAGLKLRKYA